MDIELGLTREEILNRIHEIFQAFLSDLANGEFTKFYTLKRSTSAMMFDNQTNTIVHGGDTKFIQMTLSGARKYTGMWLVLQIAQQLLLQDKTITQRELYYINPFFSNQQEADECILDVAGLLCVPRECLNIVGAVKGYFNGCITYQERSGQWTDCRLDGPTGRPITQDILRLRDDQITSDAQYIIVIEKDGIFNRLGEDQFFHNIPSILVTGRGFPDLATRVFVKKLSERFQIPVLCLCDCNPFGLSILLSYKFGSARMPIDSICYAVDAKWIGLRPLEAMLLELPDVAKKPFSKHDKSRLQWLLQHPYLKIDSAYHAEVEHWTQYAYKIELEALHTKGFGYITQYLKDQVLSHNYI
ncbi:hypothetical protein THRCLA_01487 [Thraustotheca clavata]|uniref:DNA topoisomerase (ATP-hydrolyzing) n=1 Tax=Thraustotheca clavata TaxID=74557 RepID=A0A1W0A8B8_9STRA|nr:hypothetical protein THRCLA_01487 [Thraustotheca clavata]